MDLNDIKRAAREKDSSSTFCGCVCLWVCLLCPVWKKKNLNSNVTGCVFVASKVYEKKKQKVVIGGGM